MIKSTGNQSVCAQHPTSTAQRGSISCLSGSFRLHQLPSNHTRIQELSSELMIMDTTLQLPQLQENSPPLYCDSNNIPPPASPEDLQHANKLLQTSIKTPTFSNNKTHHPSRPLPSIISQSMSNDRGKRRIFTVSTLTDITSPVQTSSFNH